MNVLLQHSLYMNEREMTRVSLISVINVHFNGVVLFKTSRNITESIS
jgi:hypothetical protein